MGHLASGTFCNAKLSVAWLVMRDFVKTDVDANQHVYIKGTKECKSR